MSCCGAITLHEKAKYHVRTKFQMFSSAVSFAPPMLASSEQQRFAAQHENVLLHLPPVQPIPVTVEQHPGQPPPFRQSLGQPLPPGQPSAPPQREVLQQQPQQGNVQHQEHNPHHLAPLANVDPPAQILEPATFQPVLVDLQLPLQLNTALSLLQAKSGLVKRLPPKAPSGSVWRVDDRGSNHENWRGQMYNWVQPSGAQPRLNGEMFRRVFHIRTKERQKKGDNRFHSTCPSFTCSLSLNVMLNLGQPEKDRLSFSIQNHYSFHSFNALHVLLQIPWSSTQVSNDGLEHALPVSRSSSCPLPW